MAKTASSFVALAILMILSFIVSTYEYNHVHSQYEKVIKVATDGSDAHKVDPYVWFNNMK